MEAYKCSEPFVLKYWQGTDTKSMIFLMPVLTMKERSSSWTHWEASMKSKKLGLEPAQLLSTCSPFADFARMRALTPKEQSLIIKDFIIIYNHVFPAKV